MSGHLSLAKLKQAVSDGSIDTVLVCMVDMQGRLIGKRFQAEFFVDTAEDATHACNYLLANDIDMELVPGYPSASWEQGYGDRSEEHTSELQSLMRISYAVFCLKKKNTNKTETNDSKDNNTH